MASSTSAAGSATRLEAAHGLVRRGGTALLGILALLPLYSFLLAEPNLANRVVPVAMVVGAIVNPSAALLVCAGLLPLNGPIGAMLGSAVDLGEPVTLAFLAGWLLRTAFESRAGANRVAPDVIRPTVLLSVVVAASCAVQLFVIQLWVDYPWGFLRAVAQFVTRDYFRDRATFDVVATGGFWLEGLGLFVAAVTLARRQPALRRRILAMTAAGASGVAALNLNRLMSVSLRSGTTWTVLRESVQHLRVSAVFPDFNAAGSYLAMAFLILAGLAIARPPAGSRHPAARVAWVALLPGVALSLWLTGSRAALVAVAPGALLFVPFGRRWRRPLAVGGGVALVSALVLAPTLTARFDLPETTGRLLQQAFGFRRMMARAALHLTSTHPVFGVGVGAFPGTPASSSTRRCARCCRARTRTTTSSNCSPSWAWQGSRRSFGCWWRSPGSSPPRHGLGRPTAPWWGPAGASWRSVSRVWRASRCSSRRQPWPSGSRSGSSAASLATPVRPGSGAGGPRRANGGRER